MERLTKKDEYGIGIICENCPYHGICDDTSDCLRVVSEKLFAYEDTGLTPEEVEELKVIKWWSQCGTDDMMPTVFGVPVDRLRELAAADRDGRVVVLGKYQAKNRYDAADYLSDWLHEAEFEDTSVGVYAINSDIGDVLRGLITALNAGRAEADAALKEQEAQKCLSD